ncbi:MAG: cadherin-like beta sandwich domain-containing protein [Prevotellaceae bacterium]|jgi:hypothetical protein|nr:cadherin-like beta sandwich domain-containing protein [Prevotellaceae bacterium]
MKKTLLLLTVLFLSTKMWAVGEKFNIGDIMYRIESETEVSLYNVSPVPANLVIPSTVQYDGKTYTVTTIWYQALGTDSSRVAPLISVTIPESIKLVGTNSFVYTYNLQKIKINWTKAEDLPEMGWNIFYGINPNCKLIVPIGTKSIYANAEVWQDFNIVEENYLQLRSLDVAPGVGTASISPAFNRNTTNYTITVPYDCQNLMVFAEAFDTQATVFGNGIQNLQEGLNTIVVRVIYDDIVQNIYTIKATREAAPAPPSGVNDVSEDKTIVGYYSILGAKLNKEPESGIYFIKYTNGKMEKVLK